MTDANFNYMDSDFILKQRAAQEPQINTRTSPAANEELPYKQQIKQNFKHLIGKLDLEERQKLFLEHRWLEQVLWMEGKSNDCRDRHTRLKLTAIILSVITPILITTSTQLSSQKWENWFKGATIAISSVVAVAASVDEFFNYGKRWYGYRQAAESMKSEGWQFFQLTGSYQTYKDHNQAFTVFANQVEDIIRRDVNLFVSQQQSQQTQNNQPSAKDAS